MLAGAVLAGGLAACFALPTHRTSGTDQTVPQLAQWVRHGPSDYTWTYAYRTGQSAPRNYTVTVRGGRAEGPTGAPFGTMDDMLAWIASERRIVDEVSASYDPATGAVEYAYMDPDARTSDDVYGYRVLDLEIPR